MRVRLLALSLLAACTPAAIVPTPAALPISPAIAAPAALAIKDASFAPVTYIDATGFEAACTLYQRFAVIKPGERVDLVAARPACAAVKPTALLKVSDLPWNSYVTCWFRVTPAGVSVFRQGNDTACSVRAAGGVSVLSYDLNVKDSRR
jgi:hypothetical protein